MNSRKIFLCFLSSIKVISYKTFLVGDIPQAFQVEFGVTINSIPATYNVTEVEVVAKVSITFSTIDKTPKISYSFLNVQFLSSKGVIIFKGC